MIIIKREILFFVFLGLCIGFLFIDKNEVYNFYDYVNWSTIRALVVLLLLTTAMRISKVFDSFSEKFVKLFKNEKYLALFFVFLTASLAMFLTNDITLFIIVPITLSIASNISNDITKLVIFEAMASNVGSLLTPIGNPQNLYIFKEMHIGFFQFIEMMLPIFVIKIIVLFLFVWFLFDNKKLEILNVKVEKSDYFLFFSSVVFFILFIVGLEFHFVKLLIPIIIVWYLVFKKEVFLKFDYFLILTFILMFIDFNIMAKFEFIKKFIYSFNLDFFNVVNLSVVFSQIMSNVPATIFISKFSNDYQAIIYGTNIAGNGLIIASLANIIAIRMLPINGIKIFHKYSIPYFIITYILILTFLFCFNIIPIQCGSSSVG